MATQINIYTCRDTKAELFGQPFFAPNEAVAFRMIAIAARDPNSYLAQDPKSFDLYCHGSFEDHSGIIESQPPEHITSVQFIIEADQRQQAAELRKQQSLGDHDD